MYTLRKLSELIVFSNLWIAFSAAGLTLNTYFIVDQQPNFLVVLLVFLATFSVYNLQRLIKHYFQQKNASKRHLWIFNHPKVLTVFVGLSAIASALLFFRIFSLLDFIFLLPFSAISIFYAATIFSKKKALRDIPFLKVFLIAITWAVSTVVLPLIELKQPICIENGALFVLNFLFILAITIPFDIRDLKLDANTTKTIPQGIGVNKAVNLSLTLVFVCLLIAIFTFQSIGQSIALALVFYTLTFSKKEMPELYYSGILDGTIILFPIFNSLF